MKPMDFLTGINDIDDQLILSSLNFLQEDSMDKKIIKKGGLTLSKIILVAAIIAGIVGVTAFATELFPSIFTNLKEDYTKKYDTSWAKNRAEIYEKAAKANVSFEPEYIALPELNDSQIVIGEKYYDGENYLIAYSLEENNVPARFDFGPDSPNFKKLRTNYPKPGRNFDLDECLEKKLWSETTYNKCKAQLKADEMECIKTASSYIALYNELRPNLAEEEWNRACLELRGTGSTGVVIRKIKLQYDVYLEDGSILPNPTWENEEFGGSGKGINKTETGNALVYFGLPEEYRNLETLRLCFKFKIIDEYHFIHAEKGAKKHIEPVTEVLVPVTLTKAKP